MTTSVLFDEAPARPELVKHTTVAGRYKNTSSIDTTNVDQYRQGVEINLPIYQGIGIAKIWTGELGGFLRQSTFGMGAGGVERRAAFVEDGTNESDGPWIVDGAIEALTIRSSVTGETLDGGDDGHGVRGTLMGGTEDGFGRSAQVMWTRMFDTTARGTGPFSDEADTMGGLPLSRGVLSPPALVRPVDDGTTKSGVRMPVNADPTIMSALRAMSPASDFGTVPPGYVGSAAGYTYDSQPGIGTDSLAFGGLDR